MSTAAAVAARTPAIPDGPGIFHGVPFEDYLRWPYVSQTTLKVGEKSMAHLRAAIDGERMIEPTDDMVLGSALHTAFLEPETIIDRVVRWDGGTRRGKAWDEFKAENSGRYILTPAMHEKLMGMIRSLRRHPVVRQWLGRIEDVEVSAVADVYGLRMKGRTDALTPDPLFDLKKTRDGDAARFVSSAIRFGYDIQGAIYRQMFNRDRIILLCVEDSPPYDVVPYELSPAMLRRGERKAKELISAYLACERSGHWPGRSDEVVMLELPEWAEMDSGITIGGEGAFDGDDEEEVF